MIPRGEVEGLDRGEVESDRKKYWERFYEKVSDRIYWEWADCVLSVRADRGRVQHHCGDQ